MMPGGGGQTGLRAVTALVQARTGLNLSANLSGNAEAGIRTAMKRGGIEDIPTYVDRVSTDDRLFDDLVSAITVGETYFFRDPAHFSFIGESVLPGVRQSRGAAHVFRAWSAGCASGEEVYSLAILLEQAGMGDRSFLLATDISGAALAKARAGLYSAWSLRGVDGAVTKRYLTRRGNAFALDERFRRRVVFERLNLARDAYPSYAVGTWGMDLVLCRNVLMYFDRESVRRVAAGLFGTLAPGGWLITGPSDPLLEKYAPFEVTVMPFGIVYRRPDVATPCPVNGAVAGDLPPAQSPPRSEPPLTDSSRRAEIVSAPPSHAGDPLVEAERAFAAGDYRRVAALTRGLMASERACALGVRALANLGAIVEAEEAAAEAARRHPLSPFLNFLWAVVLLGVGRREDALERVRRVLYLDRASAVAHLTAGLILTELGRAKLARSAYRRAHVLLSALPEGASVEWCEGEAAGSLAAFAVAQAELLDASRQEEPREP